MVALRAAGRLSPMDDHRTHVMRRSLPARSHASASWRRAAPGTANAASAYPPSTQSGMIVLYMRFALEGRAKFSRETRPSVMGIRGVCAQRSRCCGRTRMAGARRAPSASALRTVAGLVNTDRRV